VLRAVKVDEICDNSSVGQDLLKSLFVSLSSQYAENVNQNYTGKEKRGEEKKAQPGHTI
jgi:hypothetical protein